MDLLLGVFIGLVTTLLVVVSWRYFRRGMKPSSVVSVHANLDAIRSVGELVVLKVFIQKIVTSTDHQLGEWGAKWMQWLLSSKKAAMIFDFQVDFRYNLRDPQFRISDDGAGNLRFTMPPCFYEIHLRDMSIYDERGAALAPILLPEWIGRVVGGRFSEKDKNELISMARFQAEEMARRLANQMVGEVQQSAETTLRQIGHGMNFQAIEFEFHDQEPRQGAIDMSNLEKTAQNAVVASQRMG